LAFFDSLISASLIKKSRILENLRLDQNSQRFSKGYSLESQHMSKQRSGIKFSIVSIHELRHMPKEFIGFALKYHNRLPFSILR